LAQRRGQDALFECLAGVLPTDRGVVTLDGRALTRLAEINANLFYVPDVIAPWPSQSVRWALDYVIGFFTADWRCSAPM
jgi:ABC-type multidrug transport system ATPase subunit